MEVNAQCDVYSFGVVTLEIIMGTHPGIFFLIFVVRIVLFVVIWITCPSNANCGCCGLTHFPSNRSRSRGSGLFCEDSVCMFESQSAISSNNEASFSTPLNSEVAFVGAIAYDNMW
ncbi:unnamed protein product [Prunus brigantina]